MITEFLLAQVETRARACYADGDPGHDFAHVLRVTTTAVRFARALGADEPVVRIAALLHDIVNLPKKIG